MWDKIEYYAKKIFDWFINAFVYIALLCGYIWFCLEIGNYIFKQYTTLSLLIGAFIYFYYLWKKEEEKEN